VRDRQRGDDPAQTGGRKALLTSLTLAGGLAFGTLCTLAAARVAIDAIQASGGERILYAVVAVFFYLLAALLIVGTVDRAVRPLPAFGGPGPDTYDCPTSIPRTPTASGIEFIVDRPARGAIGCSGLFHGS
jgi:hypothetical protein